MAKGSSSLRNNKARSSKPYDASNSFVRKVTSQVTNLFPQPEWLTRWFSTPTNQQNVESDDDDEGEAPPVPQPPPIKRARISLNRTFPANSFRVADEAEVRDRRPHFESPVVSAEVRDRRPHFESPSPVRHSFSDAVAGPSGLGTSARFSSSANLQSTMVSETLENKINDGGSDSSESTSGCSSLVPQAIKQSQGESLAARRRAIDEKLSLTNHLQSPRSLFPNRVRTPRIVPPPSSRRPSFNASVFGSPLLEADKLPSRELSPFYSGRTMYGGASAYRRPRDSLPHSDLNVSKRGIQVRPVNDTKTSPEASMSHTARRILEALEQFSSPIQDAKRMPLHSPMYRPPLGSKRKCTESVNRPPPPPPRPPTPARTGPPTQSLTVPSIADLIKMRCKEKLQDSMESARRIASISAEPYSIRPTEERKRARHGGKIMTSSHIEDETIEEVNLPEIALPITTMPKFDIMVPPASSTVSSVKPHSFKFSPPVTVTSASPNVISKGEFTFSAPLSTHRGETTMTQNFIPRCPSVLESVDSLKKKPKMVAKSNGQSNSVGFEIKPASELKPGSVMDFFAQQKKEESGKDKGSVGFGEAFKPASGTWECDVCMIRNKADATVCIACENPCKAKAAVVSKQNSGWTCSSCLVPNKASDTACVCCTNPKSSEVSVKEPATESWKCMACDAVNPASSSTCKDCWCNKPNKSVNPSKSSSAKAESMWKYSSCTTSNEKSSTICKKTKPGSNEVSSKLTLNFEVPAEASKFKFGIDKSENPSVTGDKLGGFKFGETGTTASPLNFTFGVPSSTVVQNDKPKDVTVTSASSSCITAVTKRSQNENASKLDQKGEVSSAKLVQGSNVLENTSTKKSIVGSDSDSTRKRKSGGLESAVNEVKSAQKRKAESSELVANEVKSVHTEKTKPVTSNTNAENMVKTTIPSIFLAAVSSSSLNAGTPVSTKTTTSGGFSFVSSSTSAEKSVSTTASTTSTAVVSTPTFVFGTAAAKNEESSSVKKPVSIFNAPASTVVAVPSFGSSVTSSVGFGSNTNAVSSSNAVVSATLTFGTTSPSTKSIFGGTTTTTPVTTTVSTPTTKASFTPPVTTTPSFGVPDTTTPAFGTPVTKPSSATTTSASSTFVGGSIPAPPSLLGVTPPTTMPSFGGGLPTPSPSFGGTATTTAPAALSFNATSTTKPSPFAPATTTITAVGFNSSSSATPIFGTSAGGSVPAFASTPATTSAFGSTSATAPSPFDGTPVTTPAFGTNTSATPTFGSASTTIAPAFGTSTSSFDSGAKPGSFSNSTPAPNFGIPASKTPFGATPVTHGFGMPSATPTFGTAGASTGSFGTGSTPTFGTPVTTSAVSFSTQAATPSSGASVGGFGTSSAAFGTPVTTSVVSFGTQAVTPAFGSSNPSFGTPKTVPATSAPIFGTPTTTSSFGSGFGNSATPAFGGFSSGTLKSGAASSTPGAFVFKGNQTPIFNASQPTTNNTERPPSKVPNFGFGTANAGTSNTTASAPGFGTFNFTAGSSAAPSVFGATPGGSDATSSSVFAAGTTPAFGSSSINSGFGSGGFNFTGGSNPSSQPFSFSATQSNQNSAPAFGQPTQPAAPPTFNPNVRPSFDFTGGETPQFTAQSSNLTPTVRRIKKAVRRTNR